MRRGVTAPHKPIRVENVPQFNTPSSLSKHATLSPEAARKQTAISINRVAIRGSGWSSKRPASQARVEDRYSVSGSQKMGFNDETGRIADRLVATSHGVRPPSRHLTPPKAVGLDLPSTPITPPNMPQDDMFEKTWSHGMSIRENVERVRRSQRNLSSRDSKGARPKSVKAWERPQEDSSARVKTSSVRPKSRESKQEPEIIQQENRKRPVTCKAYQIPLIVTVDNDLNPSVEKTSFGKIINRRVCSASLAREKKVPLAKKGTFRSSLDPEFLKMFE
mmetsp:Transcript_19545/g.35774  ORF Transcript_19545/g.35774 Transcript_19545/m.35774 type:complete len:277 (-) Transcript_19545:576-1406(-)